MKKIKLIFLIIAMSIYTNYAKADLNTSLKIYLEGKNLEEGATQIYLLKRCSAIYAYASGIVLKSDAVSSKNFIEISNNLLFKSVELMVIDENKILEEAQEEAEKNRKELFSNYIADGKKNWEKNKSHFKGSYISEDMAICSKLTEEN
jgi:fructoselysine-6-P-deglycase FrlB-like protein